ncbi:pupal cuticle protein Edg-78E-like [Toxorhynchites rutilus septentrionalis]|uniref:pupal cuticle protein Edg-78E-like n=1 Tax=Toxorhynchites rutilus septentrionalis TaxID=329112 RepID=UPI0024785C47|nr:pupal cuticle protein Edg-78E-like [Toxorhynchites rutilus septentrionalis]
MKAKIAVLGALVLVTFANAQHAKLVEREQNLDPDGTYSYQYRLSDGTEAQEQGRGGQFVTGGYRYTSPEGELIQITYTADENGYNPQGDAIPQPPPIPEAILRALEYIRTHARPSRK